MNIFWEVMILKDDYIRIRCTPTVKAAAKELAAANDMTLTDYLVFLILMEHHKFGAKGKTGRD